jgi:filamentous hemagglutinin
MMRIGSTLATLPTLLLPVTLLPVLAHAHIIPDAAAPAKQQAIVGAAANGVPLVHIQTPTAGGVSRNVFSQFDVERNGAILNNATQATSTALAGWVQANPLLDRAASVIVNEVNSSHPSFLNGYVEVAGQRAQVVVANPSGIRCDGCGFINTSRATLTTGVPQYSASGNLDSYLVRRGTVSFNGDGLDTKGADFTDVLSRAVQVNAALHARALNVVAGSNEIGARDLHTRVIAAGGDNPGGDDKPGSDDKPRFALDVSALGGMYAGKIWLVGTEAGVGVRHAGILGGGASEIHITAAGRLEVTGGIDSAGRLEITSAGINNTGTITASNSVSLQSTSEITNTGLINGGDVLLKGTTVNNLGTGRIYGDHIALEADRVVNDVDNATGGAAGGAATPSASNTTPVIAARSRLDIAAKHITNREGALLYSEGDLAIGRYLDTENHASGQALRLDNLSATIEAGGDMYLAVDDIHNINTHYSTRTQTRSPQSIVEVAGEGSPNRYAPDAPDVYAYIDESYHLHTPEGNYERWLRYRYQRTITEEVTATSSPAQIIAGGNLHLRGQTLTNDKSRIVAGNDLDVQVTSLNNIDATGTRTTTDIGAVDSFWRDHRKGRDRTGSSEAGYEPPPLVQSISLGVVGYEGQTPSTAAQGADISHGNGQSTRSIPLAATLPNSGLYRVAPEARGYVVETDPRFTNYKQWLGSDYLLQQLALDPQQMHKRLGDGFYEQRLVREQIAQLTGRRFLPGYRHDEAQFQALMDNASTFAKAYALRPGIALSAGQMAALTSDIVWLVEKDITLADGQVTRALVPQVYLQVRAGDLKPDGALLGGEQVTLSLTGDLTNSGTIAAGQHVNLSAANINNLSGTIAGGSVNVDATHDIQSLGGSIKAERALTLTAGHDITIASTTRSSSNAQGSRTDIDRTAGLYVNHDDGQIAVAAGHNLTLKAAAIQQGMPAVSNGVTDTAATRVSDKASNTTSNAASTSDSNAVPTSDSNTAVTPSPTTGRIMLAAGNDVRFDTVTEVHSESVNWGGGNYRRESRQTDIATTIDAAGAVDIAAGRDIVLRGAQIATRDSGIKLNASRDVTLSTAESHVSVDEAHRHTRRGFLSRTTTSSRHTLEQITQHGTLLSGNRVSVQSGQDIKVSGSDIASSQGTALDAARNVSIEAATNTHNETHLEQKRTSGLMSSGGFGITIGNRSVKSTSDTTATTAVASTVGSTQGDVIIKAGDALTQTGSKVIAPQGDVTIAARKVDIVEARNHQTTVTETQFRQSGLTVAVANPIVTAVQTAQAMGQAASNTKDPRMKALAAANTAMAAKNAIDAVIAGQGRTLNGKADQIGTGTDAAGNASSRDANVVDKLGGIQLSMSVGSAKSDSRTVVRTSDAVASSVSAGGYVRITAEGDKAHSDLTVQGSQITAGAQVNLVAEHALTLQAADNTETQTGTSSSSSASVGLILDSKGGLGVNASASQGRGNASGQDQRWTNATVNAGQQVVLQSGANTTLKGGVVSAPEVTVAAGGKLDIESLQDTSTYTSRQKQLGGSATLGTAPSANVNAAKSNIDSTYTSVTEQSGMKAGDGGFDIRVAGDTTLKGGVISSTQAAVDAKRNQFSSGGQVAATDIENHAHYQAESVSVNLGAGFSAQGKLAPSGTGVGFGKDSDSAASITHAGISGMAGNPGLSGTANGSGNPTNLGDATVRTGDKAAGIAKIFDVDKVQKEVAAQTQITQMFSTLAPKAVATYADGQIKALKEKLTTETDPKQRAAMIDEKARWDEGGRYRVLMHTAVGALVGDASGAAGAGAAGIAAPKLSELQANFEDTLVKPGMNDLP